MMDMEHCLDCKKEEMSKKYDSMSSRISSMKWHQDDYDRMKGKGRFRKDHPDSFKMMETMMDEKTNMLKKHMGHDLPTEKALEDKPTPATTGIYIG